MSTLCSVACSLAFGQLSYSSGSKTWALPAVAAGGCSENNTAHVIRSGPLFTSNCFCVSVAKAFSQGFIDLITFILCESFTLVEDKLHFILNQSSSVLCCNRPKLLYSVIRLQLGLPEINEVKVLRLLYNKTDMLKGRIQISKATWKGRKKKSNTHTIITLRKEVHCRKVLGTFRSVWPQRSAGCGAGQKLRHAHRARPFMALKANKINDESLSITYFCELAVKLNCHFQCWK